MEMFRTVGAEDMEEEVGPGSDRSNGFKWVELRSPTLLTSWFAKVPTKSCFQPRKRAKLAPSPAFSHIDYVEDADTRNTEGTACVQALLRQECLQHVGEMACLLRT